MACGDGGCRHFKTHAQICGKPGATGIEISFTRDGSAPLIATEVSVKPHRVIVATSVVSMVAMLVVAGAWFVEAQAEYRQLKATEASTAQLVADAKKRLAEQQRILDRLKSDPAFVEKVVRQNLFYARPKEIIFRFED